MIVRSASLAPVVFLASIGLAGRRQAHSQRILRLVELATVRSPEAPQHTFTGVVVTGVQSNMGFRVGGKIIERMVDIGAFVKRGQPLIRIDRNDLALAIAEQDPAVASAKARAIQTAVDEARYAALEGRSGDPAGYGILVRHEYSSFNSDDRPVCIRGPPTPSAHELNHLPHSV